MAGATDVVAHLEFRLQRAFLSEKIKKENVSNRGNIFA
jgi:hypothetical protein